MRQSTACGASALLARVSAFSANRHLSLQSMPFAFALIAATLLAGCDDQPRRTAKSNKPKAAAKNSEPVVEAKKPAPKKPTTKKSNSAQAGAANSGQTFEDPTEFTGGPTQFDEPKFDNPRRTDGPTDLPDPNDPNAQASPIGSPATKPSSSASKTALADFATRLEQLTAAKTAALVKPAKVTSTAKKPAADSSDDEPSADNADAGAEVSAEVLAERAKEHVFSDTLSFVDDAIAADDFAMAQKGIALLEGIAPQLGDQQLAAESTKSKRRVQQYETAFKRTTAAREALAKNPDDAASNYTVGSYLCMLKADWDAGLPLLVKGNDAASSKAAKLDLAAPKEPTERQAVADAWWAIADRESAIAKAQAMLRARHWYSLVRPTLDAEAQDKLRSRIEMIDKFAVSTGVNIELGLDAVLTEKTGRLNDAQRARVQKLLGDFRRAANNPAQLESIVTKLLSIGGAAVPQLLVEVNKILQPQVKLYGEAFSKQAAAVQASRGGANTAEVERLRAQVLALKELPNLTKDMIVQQGDPAIAKLHEMLVVDRAAVLEKSPGLRDARKKLLIVGRQWERTNVALVAAMQEEEAKANKSRKPSRKPMNDTASVSTNVPLEMQAAGKKDTGKKDTAKGDAAKGDAAKGDKAADQVEKSTIQAPPSFEKYLEGEEELAAKMVMPMDESARTVLAENGKLIGQIETEEARAILACNLTRQLLGLSALKIDLKLCAAARDHSKDMATLGFFAHESPVPGKKTPWDRAKNFDTSASGENIAAGYGDGNAANQGWFHSPGHHKNMLGGHKRIGLGVHNTHYTELFGG